MRRPPLQAILWDIDGTLLDSEPWHRDATIAVCRQHGYELSDQGYTATLGVAFTDLYAQLHAVRPMPLSFQAWADAITDAYLERIAEVEARASAFALVDAFARRGRRWTRMPAAARMMAENGAACGRPACPTPAGGWSRRISAPWPFRISSSPSAATT